MLEPTLTPGLPPAPDPDEVAAAYRTFDRSLARGAAGTAAATVREWDSLRRDLQTWTSLTKLRFTQDTRDPSARAARDRCDEFGAVLTGYDTAVKRRLAMSDERTTLTTAIGGHAFALWDNDLATYDPAVEADLVTEARLEGQYTQAIADIEVTFDGERHNLSSLQRYASHPDRALREGAAAARWTALGERADVLDGIFDQLVRTRDRIARTLGFAGFTELGYARMRRVDYDRAAVERYREAVVEQIVPIAQKLMTRAAQHLGIAEVAVWDEKFLAAEPPPQPRGDARWIMAQTVAGFAELDPRLGEFVRMMDARELTDLIARPGKAGGGYCTMFPALGVPFIFTNFNGTNSDIKVLMHELGHAFQTFSSRALPVIDYLWPTYEAAEVHSMSLEFLTWPLMERFFGDEADAYRRGHLADSIAFLPYGVAVDHFQHLVYERPDASPGERHAMWQFCERRYLPWRAYGDLERPAAGAFWQAQPHIYNSPFYYIDYTLALCCALQMWVSAIGEPRETLRRYIDLCARGGAAPFRTLVAGAGMVDPFDPSALPAVAAKAQLYLAL